MILFFSHGQTPLRRFVLITLITLGLFLVAAGVQAANATVEAPARSATAPSATYSSGTTPPAAFLSSLYMWFLGFVGIAALFAFTLGGILYMLAGTIESTKQAQHWIWNGLWGLLIAASSYLLLRTINPDLVQHGFQIETGGSSAPTTQPARPSIEPGKNEPGP